MNKEHRAHADTLQGIETHWFTVVRACVSKCVVHFYQCRGQLVKFNMSYLHEKKMKYGRRGGKTLRSANSGMRQVFKELKLTCFFSNSSTVLLFSYLSYF